jgi:hypothetical protein
MSLLINVLFFCQTNDEKIHPDFVRYFKASPVLKQTSGGKIVQIPEGFVLIGVSAFAITDKTPDELRQAEDDCVKKARASLVGTRGIKVYSVTRVEDEATVKIEDEKTDETNISKFTAVTEEIITGKVAGSEVIGRWLSADGTERFIAVGVKLNKKGEKLPYLADFQVILKEVLDGGKTDSAKSMVEQMDQSWRGRLVSACELAIKDANGGRRAAAVSALGWGLYRWNDGENLFLKTLSDQDALVVKAGLETFGSVGSVKADRFKSVIKVAKERNDSAREAAVAVIARVRPESMDLLDLYFDTAMGDDPEISAACVKSLDGKNIGVRRRMSLSRQLIKGSNRPNRLSGLKMLASLKDDDRQPVLEGLLMEVGSRDPATSLLATNLVETLLPMKSEDVYTLGNHLAQGPATGRLLVAQIVASMGRDGAGLIPSLVLMLNETDSRMVVIALGVLGKVGAPGLVPVDKIKEKAKSEMQDVRLAAINALGDLGPQSGCQTELVEALGDSSRIVARAASRGLAKYSPAFSRENVTSLRKFLQSKNIVVRRYSLRALADMGGDAAALSNEAVIGLYDQDPVIQLATLKVIMNAGISDRATTQRITNILAAQLDGASGSGVVSGEGIGPDQVTLEASPSVAFVSSNDGEGAGFLVSPRLVLMSKSLGSEVGQLTGVAFPGSPVFSGRSLKGKVIKVHPDLDLSLIELESNPGISPLLLGDDLKEHESGKLVSMEVAGNFSVGLRVFSQTAKVESREGSMLIVSLPSNIRAGGSPLVALDGTVRGMKRSGQNQNESKSEFISSVTIANWLGNGIGIDSAAAKTFISEEMEKATVSPERLASGALEYLTKAGPQAATAKDVLIRCVKSPLLASNRRQSFTAVGSLKAEGVPLVDDLLEMTRNPGARGNPSLEQFKSLFLYTGDNMLISQTLASLGAPAAKKVSEGLLRKEPEIRFMALMAIEMMDKDGKDAKPLVFRSSLPINEKNIYIQVQAKRNYERLERLFKTR